MCSIRWQIWWNFLVFFGNTITNTNTSCDLLTATMQQTVIHCDWRPIPHGTRYRECQHQRTASPTFLLYQCIRGISSAVFVCVLVFGCRHKCREHCARKRIFPTLTKLSYQSRCLIAWPVRASVPEEPLSYPEDGDGVFLLNVATCRPNYTVPHSSRQ
jgi:hypothetical protein